MRNVESVMLLITDIVLTYLNTTKCNVSIGLYAVFKYVIIMLQLKINPLITFFCTYSVKNIATQRKEKFFTINSQLWLCNYKHKAFLEYDLMLEVKKSLKKNLINKFN